MFSWDRSLSWQIESDPARSSEVEVRLDPDGTGRTRGVLTQRHLDRHGAGWPQGLLAAGSAVAFGPVVDGAKTYGVAVVLAGDRAEAEALAADDPAVTGLGFRTEILPMRSLVTAAGRFDA